MFSETQQGEVLMAIDIEDSTFNVDPHKIPSSSDFYHIRQSGRHTVPEQDEQIFVQRFAQIADQHQRDYRRLREYVIDAAFVRSYHLDPDFENRPIASILRNFWKQTGNNTHRFCDVICAAIGACPITEINIYE